LISPDGDGIVVHDSEERASDGLNTACGAPPPTFLDDET